MDIEIRELSAFEQFEEIASLQERIWNLSDADKISTITLKALTMQYPIMGLVIGAYYNNQIIGFAICFPTREPTTMYGLIMGVLPDFQNSDIGNRMGIKILELCLKQNITKVCWTFEPLEAILGYLYLNKWGAVVVKYEQNYYQLKDEFSKKLPLDRFIVDCNLHSNRVIERINKKIEIRSLQKALHEFPVAQWNNFPGEKSVLVEIPGNFQKMKNGKMEELIEYRMKTRTIFENYITKHGYFIAEIISGEINGEKHNYYLMEKRSFI